MQLATVKYTVRFDECNLTEQQYWLSIASKWKCSRRSIQATSTDTNLSICNVFMKNSRSTLMQIRGWVCGAVRWASVCVRVVPCNVHAGPICMMYFSFDIPLYSVPCTDIFVAIHKRRKQKKKKNQSIPTPKMTRRKQSNCNLSVCVWFIKREKSNYTKYTVVDRTEKSWCECECLSYTRIWLTQKHVYPICVSSNTRSN